MASEDKNKVQLTEKEQFIEFMAISICLMLLVGSAIKILFL